MKEKQFGVLGLGRFGESLAVTLSELGAEVIVVDKSEEKIQNIANQVTYAVQADVSDLNALKSIGLKNVDIAIISITSDINSNIMAVINCQELGIPEIYSKANNHQHERVLLKLGVEAVFSPEKDMGISVAHRLYQGDFLQELELDSNYSIVEIESLKSWFGKSLDELDLRSRYGINVVAILEGDNINIAPLPSDEIGIASKLIVLG
ncbi:MAG: potassium channel family protein, partial [Eubacteriaceae bacterium]